MPKFLCLTSHNLDGPDYGAALRCRNLFILLQKFGEVDVVLASDEKFWDDQLKPTCGGFKLLGAIHFHAARRTFKDKLQRELDSRFIKTHPFEINPTDQQWLKEQFPKYDLVWVHGLLIANGAGIWRWPNSVLDIDDIPSAYFSSLLTQTEQPIQKLRYRRLKFLWRRREKKMAERFDAISVCSAPDRQLLSALSNVFVVKNGFAAPANNPQRNLAWPPRIGFIGKLSYAPNCIGLMWFIDHVWPLIIEQAADTRLRLIGEQTDTEHWPLHIDGLGWLADAAEEMTTWSLAIVPILTGGGTRIKIAEAFSRLCPVVSTSLGSYGYDVQDGHELMLADTPEAFAQKCLQILTSPAQGQALAAAAWQKFNANWTWEKQTENIGKIVATVLKQA